MRLSLTGSTNIGALLGLPQEIWSTQEPNGGHSCDHVEKILSNFEASLKSLQRYIFLRQPMAQDIWVGAIFAHHNPKLSTQKWPFFTYFCGHFLVNFLLFSRTNFEAHFGTHFGTRTPQKKARWPHKTHQEIHRQKNMHWQKPSKTHSIWCFFEPECLLNTTTESQRKLVRKTPRPQNPKKRDRKSTPKNTQSWFTFETHSDPQMDPKKHQKNNKN